MWKTVEDQKQKSFFLAMLAGKYEHTMDSKRRLPLPARLRGELGKTVILTRGLEGCVFVYPQAEWLTFAEKVNKLPMSQASARSIARLFFGSAAEVELDSLGRVLIPDHLKTHGTLRREVVIIGTGARLELWDKEKWEQYQGHEIEDMGDTIAELKEFGI